MKELNIFLLLNIYLVKRSKVGRVSQEFLSSVLDMLKLRYLLDPQVEMSGSKFYVRLAFREEVQPGDTNEHIFSLLMVF